MMPSSWSKLWRRGHVRDALVARDAEGSGPAYVVIGIGVNAVLGEALKRRVEASGARAADLLGGLEPPSYRAASVAEAGG